MDTIRFKNLSQHKNILHGISTRDFGSVKNSDNTVNRKNLESFLSSLNISKNGICMDQVHGGNAVVLSDGKNLLIENTDGLVTCTKNIALCVMTADCLPILLFDPIRCVIGVAHGGRKGLLNGIIKNTVEKFKDFQSDPKDIKVGIGPGIEEKCYEVDGKKVNIRKMANDQLMHEGIKPENIENLDICTRCDENNFYSFRRGDKNERFVSSISLL